MERRELHGGTEGDPARGSGRGEGGREEGEICVRGAEALDEKSVRGLCSGGPNARITWLSRARRSNAMLD